MDIEIFSNNSNSATEEFTNLLKTEFSKNKNLEEGKVIECKISKITENYAYLSADGLKQEPILDINELKTIGLFDKIKEGGKISVLLEKLEHPKTGEIIVSAEKALKLAGWEKIVSMYKNEEPIMGRIIRKCKGGAEVSIDELNLLAFLPGSMISDTPLKNFDHLISVPQKFAIVKLDMQRGNVVVSRKHIITSFKAADKKKIIEGYKIGDIVSGETKGFSSFGAFFRLENGLDVLCHTSELSYTRVNHPDEVLSIAEKKDLKIISIDMEKLQLGVSLKSMGPDPFDDIDKYEVGKTYKIKIIKIADFGAFGDLQEGLTVLLHQSELSHTKKNASAKKMFSVNQEISVVIKEIDKEQKRIAVSYKMTMDNPYDAFDKKYNVGDIVDTKVVAKNEYSLFVKMNELDLEMFLHCNNLTYKSNSEEELTKYKIGDKLKVKILESKIDEQKIRVGLREAMGPDPIDFFKDKNLNDKITCKVISTDKKRGLIVSPIGCDMEFNIKKSAIAMNPGDARPERWTGGESVDVCVAEKDLDRRKITLSIKLLEEIEKKEALEKYGSEGSGKNLPFSSLSEDLKKKDKNKE
tara:strand:- start:4109 stop:5851 length:1743 start_codon:yes stop_codon:yes gene_type:complete